MHNPPSQWTLDDYAAHYAETLSRPANGWGQHYSPIFGLSHHIMREARRHWTAEEVEAAFTAALRATPNA